MGGAESSRTWKSQLNLSMALEIPGWGGYRKPGPSPFPVPCLAPPHRRILRSQPAPSVWKVSLWTLGVSLRRLAGPPSLRETVLPAPWGARGREGRHTGPSLPPARACLLPLGRGGSDSPACPLRHRGIGTAAPCCLPRCTSFPEPLPGPQRPFPSGLLLPVSAGLCTLQDPGTPQECWVP